MRTRTRMRLYHAAGETAQDAGHYAARAGRWLEDSLWVDDSEGLAEAAQRVQRALGEHLAKVAKELSRLEEEEYSERFRAKVLRKKREGQMTELSERLVMARTVMTGLYGRSEAIRYFGKGKTPRQPDRLLRLATRVVDRLRRAEPLPASGPKVPGSVLSTEAMAAHVEETAKKLEATLEDLAQRELGAGLYLMQKNQLEAQLEHAQQDVARILGGFYRLGGRERLDERVKKNHRKRKLRRRRPVKSADGASMAASAVAGTARKAPITASEPPASPEAPAVTASQLLTSPEERSMERSETLTSLDDRSLEASEAITSAGCRSSEGSQLLTSPECRSIEPSKLSTSPECPSSSSVEALTSRPEAVSERCADGEPAGNAVLEQNAHGSGLSHPVRRRRANGSTASHPVSGRGANRSAPAHLVPEREADDMAA